jgi:hypothetical protein
METDVLTDLILEEELNDSDDLTEVAKFASKSKSTRTTKIKRAAGQMATYEGRRKNDLLYQKMIRYRDLYYKYRDLLKKKYRAKNVNKARS